ncbi:hypothetical protein TNCV_3027831 [Trichonephila clavipes]|nr:hypothetical protein TNCV_3027831 [Trichonephila clavipes]
MREKGGNRLVKGPDCMVDALKLPNQAPRVSVTIRLRNGSISFRLVKASQMEIRSIMFFGVKRCGTQTLTYKKKRHNQSVVKHLLLNGLFGGWSQGVTVPTWYCDTLIEIERGDSEKAAWVSQIQPSVVG